MSDNVSRLDLALTVRVEPDYLPIAVRSLREFEKWRREHDGRIKRRLIDGGADGSTLEIGSRSSAQFGRIYDKHAESPFGYEKGCWRYEVEYKDEYAKAIAEQVYSAPNREPTIAALVAGFFRDRGITVPPVSSLDKARYREFREKVTAEDRLEYLHSNVRPMVRELALQVGEKTVLDALGLWYDPPEGQQRLPETKEGDREDASR